MALCGTVSDMSRLSGALLLMPSRVWAQVGWNSVTVTAWRKATAAPDQAIVTVAVTSGTDKGLADILNAVESSGLTAASSTCSTNWCPNAPRDTVMTMSRLFGALLLTASLLCGQIGWNSVTVTASRGAAAPSAAPLLLVTVQASFDQSLGDIVSALSGTGITGASLTGVNGYSSILVNGQLRPALNWQFQLPVPLSGLKDTTAALVALQQKLAQQGAGVSLTFTVAGLPPAGTPACSLPDLLSDARAQAQKLAGAAGLTPQAILGLTGSVYNGALSPCALTMRFALGAMFGPSDPNAITVTASRNNVVPPDEVAVQITVNSPTAAGLDTVSAALSAAGISGATFLGLNSSAGNGPSGLQWTFSWIQPITGLKPALAALAAAQTGMEQSNSGLTLSFQVQSSQYSQAAIEAQSCSQTDLLADAHAQAQSMAAAAGASVGPILTLAQANTSAPAYIYSAVGQPVSAGLFYFPYLPACSVSVQYQLAR